MKKCKACNIYTFKDFCPKCNSQTVDPSPPKFSPADKYGKYRRMQIINTIKSNNNS